MKHHLPLKHSFLLVVIPFILIGLLTACSDTQTQKPFTIGVLAEVSIFDPVIEGVKAGMTELGYVEGKNITYLYNGATGPDSQAIDREIKNLLDQQVDMLLALGNAPILRTKQTVTEIPAVFVGSISKPVESGLVKSMRRPGGNMTGILLGGEMPKTLEWLIRISPKVKKVYVPYNPDDGVSLMFLAMLEEVPSQLKIELVPGEIRSVKEAVAAIEKLPADIDAIFRIPSPTLDPKNNELSQAAIKRGLLMASGHPLDEAVLLTLASNFFEVGKQSARLVHQVRQGVKPAELPLETAEFFLTINLKTAQAIDLDIPDDILRQADTIIR